MDAELRACKCEIGNEELCAAPGEKMTDAGLFDCTGFESDISSGRIKFDGKGVVTKSEPVTITNRCPGRISVRFNRKSNVPFPEEALTGINASLVRKRLGERIAAKT
jgi:hypothetical protein